MHCWLEVARDCFWPLQANSEWYFSFKIELNNNMKFYISTQMKKHLQCYNISSLTISPRVDSWANMQLLIQLSIFSGVSRIPHFETDNFLKIMPLKRIFCYVKRNLRSNGQRALFFVALNPARLQWGELLFGQSWFYVLNGPFTQCCFTT